MFLICHNLDESERIKLKQALLILIIFIYWKNWINNTIYFAMRKELPYYSRLLNRTKLIMHTSAQIAKVEVAQKNLPGLVEISMYMYVSVSGIRS